MSQAVPSRTAATGSLNSPFIWAPPDREWGLKGTVSLYLAVWSGGASVAFGFFPRLWLSATELKRKPLWEWSTLHEPTRKWGFGQVQNQNSCGRPKVHSEYLSVFLSWQKGHACNTPTLLWRNTSQSTLLKAPLSVLPYLAPLPPSQEREGDVA